nr:unnamed protein product [Callosobruchus analis]
MGKNQECKQPDKVTAKEDVLNTILRKIEDTNQAIMDLNKKMDEMQNDIMQDIEMAYRCGSSKDDSPRAILVGFYSAKTKNEVYSNKKNLKGSKITIREDLTATRLKIVREKVSIYGKKNVWTNNGKILWLENGNVKTLTL